MNTTCPSCGADLPKGPARVCLACFARVEDMPDGTPGKRTGPFPEIPGVPLTHPVVYAAWLAAQKGRRPG